MEKIGNKLAVWSLMGLLCLLVWSCDKKWPINGNLDGNWKLQRFETKEDAKVTECHRLYVAIQLHMVEFKDQGGNGFDSFFGEFRYDEDKETAVIYNLKGKEFTTDSNIPVEVEQLKHYGLNSQHNVFKVVKADGKYLILESDYARLFMKRF